MTTLRDGTVVDESINAHNFTRAVDVPSVFRNGARRIEGITIHHWGLLGQKFDDVVGYLASNNARQSSAHAILMGGRATSIVNPDDAAWQAGNALGNTITIGLECRPEATDADYVTVSAYIAMLRGVYGDIPLYPHKYWTNTACPGVWDLARLDAMARDTTGEDMPTAKEIVDELLNRTIPRQGPGEGGATNLGGLIAWMDANLRAIPVNVANQKFKNQYGSMITVGDQLGFIDKNINDNHKELKALLAGLSVPVSLPDAEVTTIANSLRESLAPAVIAELAKRLTA